MEFSAEVVPGDDGTVLLLSGTVNRNAKDLLEAAYRRASQQSGEMTLDFGGVDYINSTGIAVIVGVLAMARSEDREVGARGLTDHYKEVFEITRLSDFMNIHNGSASDERGR